TGPAGAQKKSDREEDALPVPIVTHSPPAPIKELAATATCGDVSSDPANCGGCGVRCASGHSCRAGRCESPTAGTSFTSMSLGASGAQALAAAPAGLTAFGTWTERGPFIGDRLDGIAVTSAGSILIVGSNGGG